MSHDARLSPWAADPGEGAWVGWYNRVARSEAEIGQVKAPVVERGASLRTHNVILTWQWTIER